MRLIAMAFGATSGPQDDDRWERSLKTGGFRDNSIGPAY